MVPACAFSVDQIADGVKKKVEQMQKVQQNVQGLND